MKLARDANGKPLFSPDGRRVQVEREDGGLTWQPVKALPEDLSPEERAEAAAAPSKGVAQQGPSGEILEKHHSAGDRTNEAPRLAEARLKQEEAKAAKLAAAARQEEARAREAEARAAEAEAKRQWAEERTRQERLETQRQAQSTRRPPLEVLPPEEETVPDDEVAAARRRADLAQAERDQQAAALEALKSRIMAETLRDEEQVARRQAREHLVGASPWQLVGWGLLGAMLGQVPGAVVFSRGCFQGDAVAGLVHTLLMVGGAVVAVLLVKQRARRRLAVMEDDAAEERKQQYLAAQEARRRKEP